MDEKNLIRQMDLIPMEILKTPITVIGAGAIGSHSVKALAQMGFSDITVYDEDIVERENMNAQGYGECHLGKPKVEALAGIVKDYTGTSITAKRERYKGGIFPGIVIPAVDNMATRKLAWDEHKGKALNTKLIIDPRMGAEIAMLYTMAPMNPDDQTTYEKTLYTDDEAMLEPCTAKATIYTALLLSGMVCKAVKDVLTGATENYPRILMWNIRENDCQIFSPATKKAEAAA